MKPHTPEWDAVTTRYRPYDCALREIRNDREAEYFADVAAYGDLPASNSTGILRNVLRLYEASPGLVSDRLWSDQNIFRVANQLRAAGASDWAVEAFVCQMRRIGRNKNARSLDPPIYATKKAVKDPYCAKQYESWWLLVAAQPSPSIALQLAVILCVGLGAGASSKDLRLLTWGDIQIERSDGGLHVDVWLHGAGDSRRVPVCEPWATRLADTIGDRPESEPDGWTVGTESRQKNMLSTLTRLVRWGGQESFTVARLRTTWTAERLSVPVRVDVLQEMLGLSTLATIIQVADLLTDEPTVDHFDQLRTTFTSSQG